MVVDHLCGGPGRQLAIISERYQNLKLPFAWGGPFSMSIESDMNRLGFSQDGRLSTENPIVRKGCRTCRLFSLFVISPIMLSPNSQSPPRQLVSITHESPVYVKKVHSSHFYQSGHLDDARLAVLEDLGLRILQIAPETFIDFLAHP